jgi:hypothetical protein
LVADLTRDKHFLSEVIRKRLEPARVSDAAVQRAIMHTVNMSGGSWVEPTP